MKTIHILEAMTDIRPEYIKSAQEKLAYGSAKPGRAPVRRRSFRKAVMIFVAVLLFAALMCGTAMAVNEDFRESVIGFLRRCFRQKTLR